MGKATRGSQENRVVLALLRSPFAPAWVLGAVPACCAVAEPRAGSAPCPTRPLKQWGPGPGALWNQNPPPRSGIRDRKVSRLNGCFLNNVFTLQTGKLYFSATGRAFVLFVKPLHFCIKGKTYSFSIAPWLLAQCSAGGLGWVRRQLGKEGEEFTY